MVLVHVQLPSWLQIHHLDCHPPFPKMFGKRQRHVPEDASPGKKLKHNIVDLYAKGTISSARCVSLLNDAGASKVAGCQLQHASGKARDLQRGLVRGSGWPPLYLCNMPLKGKTDEVVNEQAAFLLPHEVLHELVGVGDYECIASKAGDWGSGPQTTPSLGRELSLCMLDDLLGYFPFSTGDVIGSLCVHLVLGWDVHTASSLSLSLALFSLSLTSLSRRWCSQWLGVSSLQEMY